MGDGAHRRHGPRPLRLVRRVARVARAWDATSSPGCVAPKFAKWREGAARRFAEVWRGSFASLRPASRHFADFGAGGKENPIRSSARSPRPAPRASAAYGARPLAPALARALSRIRGCSAAASRLPRSRGPTSWRESRTGRGARPPGWRRRSCAGAGASCAGPR